jgi:hypothetical protein
METSKSKEITEVNNLKEKHKKCTHNDIILALNPIFIYFINNILFYQIYYRVPIQTTGIYRR